VMTVPHFFKHSRSSILTQFSDEIVRSGWSDLEHTMKFFTVRIWHVQTKSRNAAHLCGRPHARKINLWSLCSESWNLSKFYYSHRFS
jgi:hypothetical protein